LAVSFSVLEAGVVRAPVAPKAVTEQRRADVATDGTPASPGVVSPKSKQHWINDPAVKRALETFNGDIIDIR
jgi:hypothetical protein